MNRFLALTALVVGASLMTPATMMAADKRYYDRNGKDYHTWNGQEDRAYRMYLTEHHSEYRVFQKTKASDQRDYFKWRHDHPNNVLFKVEIR
jgi:hypothetical protein